MGGEEAVRKIIFTTGCASGEDWERVLELTTPRFRAYASIHGYEFRTVWYGDIDPVCWPEFDDPVRFSAGAVNVDSRRDFIFWKGNRAKLAPNWLRYAKTLDFLVEYDLVMYLDADVVIRDMARDIAHDVPEHCWLAAPINGPSPDNAGPGGPLYIARRGSREFWKRVWLGQAWKGHPSWTDGVDFMQLLGYTITEPVHKQFPSEYDSRFHEVGKEWLSWWPLKARFVHVAGGGGGGNVGWKLPLIQTAVLEAEGVV
jgi:hypothetical protein